MSAISFSFKGPFFWGCLFTAAVCATIDRGPAFGFWMFVFLAALAAVFG